MIKGIYYVSQILKKNIILLCVALLIYIPLAAEASAPVSLMEFSCNVLSDTPPFNGDTKSRDFTMDGRDFYLTPFARELGGYVILSNNSGTLMTFDLPRNPYMKAYKFTLKGADREFLYIEVGKISATDSLCTNFWIIGKYKKDGKDMYVVYSTLKNAVEQGLIYQSIDFLFDASKNELWIQGMARDRDCRNILDPDNEFYMYKGHTAYPSYNYSGYCLINAISYFWDEEAQWIGTSYNDEPIL